MLVVAVRFTGLCASPQAVRASIHELVTPWVAQRATLVGQSSCTNHYRRESMRRYATLPWQSHAYDWKAMRNAETAWEYMSLQAGLVKVFDDPGMRPRVTVARKLEPAYVTNVSTQQCVNITHVLLRAAI